MILWTVDACAGTIGKYFCPSQHTGNRNDFVWAVLNKNRFILTISNKDIEMKKWWHMGTCGKYISEYHFDKYDKIYY